MMRMHILVAIVMLGTMAGVIFVPGVQARSVGSAEHRAISVLIYLVAIGGGGAGAKIGCGDSLIPVSRRIAPTVAPLSAALRMLVANHQRFLGQSGLYNALYRARLRLRRAVVRHGSAFIHLSGRLLLGGECDNPRVAGQLKRTILQFPSVHRAYIYINNVPLHRLLSLK